jgi:hypothetical protein
VRWLALVVVAAIASFGACTLLDDDPPKNSCTKDSDCFKGQELCDLDHHICIPVDAGAQ